jgi:hypothetical protein
MYFERTHVLVVDPVLTTGDPHHFLNNIIFMPNALHARNTPSVLFTLHSKFSQSQVR